MATATGDMGARFPDIRAVITGRITGHITGRITGHITGPIHITIRTIRQWIRASHFDSGGELVAALTGMTTTLLSLMQVAADQPIATHRTWGAGWWWLWIVIGFIVLVAIFGFSGPRRRPPRSI